MLVLVHEVGRACTSTTTVVKAPHHRRVTGRLSVGVFSASPALYMRPQVLWAASTACAVLAAYQLGQRQRKTSAKDDASTAEQHAADAILAFWFSGDAAENHRTRWFATGATRDRLDEQLRAQYSSLLADAENGALIEHWQHQPQSCLALIILLDQFSRHIYRGCADRDACVARCDALALPLTEAMLAKVHYI
jgi:Bacterial protein of unknown function (DUF924)